MCRCDDDDVSINDMTTVPTYGGKQKSQNISENRVAGDTGRLLRRDDVEMRRTRTTMTCQTIVGENMMMMMKEEEEAFSCESTRAIQFY